MKFGSVIDPQAIDFSLPPDDKATVGILQQDKRKEKLPKLYVGGSKWTRQDLKSFYPKGTKDELAYYSRQFNSIELNATFYNLFSRAQILKWKNKTPEEFKFFPKIPQVISHIKRLHEVENYTEEFCDSICAFGEKLGMVFLQLHNNFTAKNLDRLAHFLNNFPKSIPLAVEVRSSDWYLDPRYYPLLEKNRVTHIIIDSAGRRDLLHMRLTTPYAFIRYAGANHFTDYSRLDDWVEKIGVWIEQGIKEVYFFMHQNVERESPLLAASLVEKLNHRYGFNLPIPPKLILT